MNHSLLAGARDLSAAPHGAAMSLTMSQAHRTLVLYVSVVSLGKIQRGIELQRHKDSAFTVFLAQWLDRVLMAYRDRILPIDLPIARRWGRLSASVGHGGADLMIAATALERNLKVTTRNVRHFQGTGVQVENPFQ